MHANSDAELERILAEVADSNRTMLAQVRSIKRATVFLAAVVGAIVLFWLVSIIAIFVQSNSMQPHLYPFFDDTEPRQSQPK